MPNDDGMQASIASVGAVNNGRRQEDKEAASGKTENMQQDESLEDGELEEGELEDVEPEPDEPEKKQEETVQIPVLDEPPNPQAATFAGAIPSLLDMKIAPPRNGVPVMKTMPRWMNKTGSRKRFGVNAFDESEDDNGEEIMKMKKMKKRKPDEKTKLKYIDHDRAEVETEELDYAELLWGMSKKSSKSRRPAAANSPPGPYDSRYASLRGPYDSPSPPANMPGPYDSPSSDDEDIPAASRKLQRHDVVSDDSVAIATTDSSVTNQPSVPSPAGIIAGGSAVAQKSKLPPKSVAVNHDSGEDSEMPISKQAFGTNHGLPAKKDTSDVSSDNRGPAAKEPPNVVKEHREPTDDASHATFRHYHQGSYGHQLPPKWPGTRDDGSGGGGASGAYKVGGTSTTGVGSPELPPQPKRRRLVDTPFEERPICRFYLEGKCAKGYECQFNHDCELPKKPYLCRFYRAGNCNKGKDCVYYHETWPCRHFHKGNCAAGDTCRFSHDELTDETKLLVDKMAAEEDAVEELVKNPPPQQPKKKSLLGDYPNPQLLAASMTMNAGDKRKAIPSLFDLPFVSMPSTTFTAAGTTTSSLSNANSTRPPMPGFMQQRMAAQSQPGLLGAPPPLPPQMTVVRLIQMRMGLVPTVPFTGLALVPGGPPPSKLPGNEPSYSRSPAAGFETGTDDAASNEVSNSVAEISIKDDSVPPSSSIPSTASTRASTSLVSSSFDVAPAQGNIATGASSQPAQTWASPMAVDTTATFASAMSAPPPSQSTQHVSSLPQPMASVAQPFQQMAQPVAQPFQQMAMPARQMVSSALPTQQFLTSNSVASAQPLLSFAQPAVSFPQRMMQPTQPLIVAGVDLSQLPPLQRDVFLRLHQFNSQQQQQSLPQQGLPPQPQPQQPLLQQPLPQQPFQLQSRPQENIMFSTPPLTSVPTAPAIDLQSKPAAANSAASSINVPRPAAPSAGGDVVNVLKLLQQQPQAGTLPRLPLAPVFNINQVLSAISVVPPSTAAAAEPSTATSAAAASDTTSSLEVNGCRAQIDYVVHPYDCGGTVIPLHVNIDDSKWDDDPRIQRWRREVELGRMPRREAPRIVPPAAPKPLDAAPHRDPRIKATDALPPSSQFQLQQQQLHIQQLVQQLMQQNSRQPMPTGITAHLPPIFATSQMPQTSVPLAMTSGLPMLPVPSGFIPQADVRVPPPLFRPSVTMTRQVVPLMSLTLNSSIGQQFRAANSAATPASGFAAPQIVPVTEQIPSTASSSTSASASFLDNPVASASSAVSEPVPSSALSVAEDVIPATSVATDSEDPVSSESSPKADYRNDPRFKKRKIAGGAPKKASSSSQENESNQTESSNDDTKVSSEHNKDVLTFQSPLAVANDARQSKSNSGYNRPPNKRYQELLDQNNLQPRTDHRRNQFGDSNKSSASGGGAVFAVPRALHPVVTPSVGAAGMYPVILPPDSTNVTDSQIEGSLKDMFKTIDPTASPFC